MCILVTTRTLVLTGEGTFFRTKEQNVKANHSTGIYIHYTPFTSYKNDKLYETKKCQHFTQTVSPPTCMRVKPVLRSIHNT